MTIRTGAATALLASAVLAFAAACGGGGGNDPAPMAGDLPPATCDSSLTPASPPVVLPANETMTFMVNGTTVTANGDIDTTTPGKIQNIITNNPGITELVLQNIGGSADDDSNLIACQMIRDAGWNTRVPATGLVASGGVDMFISGVQRVAEPGSRVEVHTWAGDGGVLGRDFPRTDCEHAKYIEYYRRMTLPDPAGFYFFTLQFGNAPDAQPLHDMTPAERIMWGVVTQ